MRKIISIIILFVLLFITIIPNPALAGNRDAQRISNALYSITVPTWATVLSTSTNNDYSTILSDSELSFTAKISFERVTKEDLAALREYLGDYSTEDKKLYDKIIDLKASSYDAVEKSYQNSSLFYPLKKVYSEYDFKIIDKQIQELFGTRIFSIMYNTLDASLNNVSEFSKTDIFIPSYTNGGIFNINIIIPRDRFNIEKVMKIADIITSLELKGHPAENKVPLIFVAKSNMEKSSAGIYPAFTFKNYNLKPFYNKEMGLSFLYPDFLIPTDEVDNFSGLKTASFKIDPYTTFNVNVSDSSFYSLNEAIASVLTSGRDYSINGTNVLDSPNGSIFEIKQSFTENNINYKKTSYFLSAKGNTVSYSFTTSAQTPTYSIDNIAIRILMTTKIFEKAKESTVSSNAYKAQNFGDVTANLPEGFKVQNIGGNNVKVTSPDISTFKIYIYEEKLTKTFDFEALSKLAHDNYDVIERSFALPYNIVQSTYLGGSFDYSENSSKIYRLSKYLDENNRVHYCYIVSISKGNQLYTMLIDLNSLLFKEDGKIGQTMPGILNEIAQSFRLR